MKVMANIARLANIKYIEDFVEIEKDRGEDLIEDLEWCKDNSNIWKFLMIFEIILGYIRFYESVLPSDSEELWSCLKISKGVWGYLRMSKDVWGFLRMS